MPQVSVKFQFLGVKSRPDLTVPVIDTHI